MPWVTDSVFAAAKPSLGPMSTPGTTTSYDDGGNHLFVINIKNTIVLILLVLP